MAPKLIINKNINTRINYLIITFTLDAAGLKYSASKVGFEAGFNSNYGSRKVASYVYLTATLDAAIWGAELALGEGPGRIYIVEPAGPIEDDPNLTDKKFPGNPTKSYRSRNPLRVTGELKNWLGHSPEQLKSMKDNLERLRQLGIEATED